MGGDHDCTTNAETVVLTSGGGKRWLAAVGCDAGAGRDGCEAREAVVADRPPAGISLSVLLPDQGGGRLRRHALPETAGRSAQIAISTAPAAPSMWPVAPLVELTASFFA